jgi:hypothetical protein
MKFHSLVVVDVEDVIIMMRQETDSGFSMKSMSSSSSNFSACFIARKRVCFRNNTADKKGTSMNRS